MTYFGLTIVSLMAVQAFFFFFRQVSPQGVVFAV
jgi:hypothetical protein